MIIIDRAKVLWRLQSRFHGERDLTLGNDAEMVARAAEERLQALEARLSAVERNYVSKYAQPEYEVS